MRRIAGILTSLILLLTMAMGANAATDASKLSSYATVAADGSCQVTLSVALHLEEAVDKLTFPIPKEATGVTLNGSRVSAFKSGDVRQINLSKLVRNVVGDVTFSVHYSIRDVIHSTEAGTLQLQLPLLSGFAYPIEALEFSATLPGEIQVLPSFVSGYHQARIEEDLAYTVSGATISGNSLKAMKDHETLLMSLAVSEEMFPQSIVQSQNYGWGIWAMAICAILAMGYWLIAMWNLPLHPKACTEPPQGFHAGQLGSILTNRGMDLTMTVLSWAQLGYILIQVDKKNRVWLHKRMDMGNERSESEQRYFKKLFGKANRVDTTSYRYAQLCCMAAKNPEGIQELVGRFSGNALVFRILSTGIGLFGGAALAVAVAGGAALQGILLIVMGIAGGLSGWTVQKVGYGIFLSDARLIRNSAIISAGWWLLSLFAGVWKIGLGMMAGLWAAGILLAWGGRRTAFGRQTVAQCLGLKRYLRSADKKQLQRLSDMDPGYYFRLAPYAMALGVNKAFARGFGKERLESCPYLVTESQMPMTASQWSEVLEDVARRMNARAAHLPFEKALGMLRSMTGR
ncbi:MAG: DUF2207 domain-containing protein [Oscillospiraceae bacterium]|nr:DUF2207 domain-containing protein [Oscillospiraceae bacterium]